MKSGKVKLGRTTGQIVGMTLMEKEGSGLNETEVVEEPNVESRTNKMPLVQARQHKVYKAK